jgi:alpha-L-rhamnosidase
MLFGGEDWDVRAHQPSWEPVTTVAPPAGTLRLATQPPILAGAPMPPITSTPVPGGTLHDFGIVMTGRFRCRVSGRTGGTVTVISGEQLGEAGRVVCENVLAAGEAQRDTLRLERDVEDYEWEPQFSYRGYRWMQVETTGDLRVEEVRSIPLETPLGRLGALETNDPLVAWIDTALATTFRNNLHGVPTDTPIYEKNGWTADAHLATEGLLHHFDLRDVFGKWMDDHVDAQGPDGSIPWIVPTPGWGRASDPAWSASAVLIPWYLYREYGDLGVLRRYATMATRLADQLIARAGGRLWPDRSWGDWLSPGHGVGPEGMAPIGTAMLVTILQHTARTLRVLGRSDAAYYEEEAARTADAYHLAYFDDTREHYAVKGVGYRQVLNILPLSFGIVPSGHVDAVRASLIDDLENRTDGHLDCGAIGVRHLLPVLTDAGRDDLAVTVLTRRTRPGWGAWFEAGEQTLMERWDADARSRNHYFFGSVAAWIQQRIGGMRLTEPGWVAFEISPVDDDRITRGRISHETPLGRAAVDWQHGPGGWDVRVVVPDGAVATVALGDARQELKPGEHRVRVDAARIAGPRSREPRC